MWKGALVCTEEDCFRPRSRVNDKEGVFAATPPLELVKMAITHPGGRASPKVCLRATLCAQFTPAMRHLGVGSLGGAEALAIFHQLIFDEWASGTLDKPLARINVGEKLPMSLCYHSSPRTYHTRSCRWTCATLSGAADGICPPPGEPWRQ